MTSGAAGGAGLVFGWVGVEDPVLADPDHHGGGHVGEFVGQCDRVVPGVEDEAWHLPVLPSWHVRLVRSRIWVVVTH